MARARNKDHADKDKFFKTVIMPILMVFIMSAAYYLWYNNNLNATNNNIVYIKSFMTSTGKVNDFQGKLGFKSKDDIKWFMNEEEVKIEFGKMILTWEPKVFLTKEVQESLATIGFDYKYIKKTKTMKLYWGGEELERWVN